MNFCTAILTIIWASSATGDDTKITKGISKTDWSSLPQMESFNSYEEMQTYYNRMQRYDAIDNPKNDSYIAAYNLHHEKELNADSHRIKRSTPEFIKFELSDAKEPDEATKNFFRKIHENIQKSLNLSKVAADEQPQNHSTIEKRSLQLYNTGNNYLQPSRNIYSQNFEPSYGTDTERYNGYHFDQFMVKGKQYTSNENQNVIYNPKLSYYSSEPRYVAPYAPPRGRNSKSVHVVNFQARIPEASQAHIITEPVRAVKVIPEINYVIKEVPAPALKVSEPISHQHLSGPITSQNEIGYQGYGYALIKSVPEQLQEQIPYAGPEQFREDIIKQHHLQAGDEQLVQKEIQSGKRNPLHPFNESKYSALTSLVGKSPSDQLDGLSFLLGKEYQKPHRPQDSTAPIVFHPGSGESSRTGQMRESKLDQNDNTVQVLQSAEPIKPITEAPEEASNAYGKVSGPAVEITPHPPPFSYKSVQSAGLSPNYESLAHDEELRYASRYAFGYRVRDFHTGNDFGHKQNRDVHGTTTGHYHILLPDGRIQNVIYRADKSGFHADVSFTPSHH